MDDTVLSFARSLAAIIDKKRQIIVVPNMGNAGDALINYAVYATLRRFSIPFRVQQATKGPLRPDDECQYLVMSNGGLHFEHNPMDDIVSEINRSRAKLALLSSTIHERDRLIMSLRPDVVIQARERVTHRYINTLRPDLICHLTEDATMSIADGSADFPRLELMSGLAMRIRMILKSLVKHQLRSFALSPLAHRDHIHALRTDSERTVQPPPDNVDISDILCVRNMGTFWAERCSGMFLAILRAARSIDTNRLHVAIGCGLVGTKCRLYDNNYFKCRAVYEQSLKHRFPHVEYAPLPGETAGA